MKLGRAEHHLRAAMRNATTAVKGSHHTSNAKGNGTAAGGQTQNNDAQPHGDDAQVFNFTIWLLTALAVLFLSLRLYCKLKRHRRLWWDDYLLIASWAALAASCAVLSYCTGLGFGKHSWDIDDISHLLLVSQAGGFCSILAALWSKTSFAMTLLRISNGWTKHFVWFVIVTVNLALGFNAILQWIQCWPVAKLWEPYLHGKCLARSLVYGYNLFTASYSGAMDIALSFLPWQIIWRVTMNKKEKLGVVLAMSMGVFAGITSIMKTVTLYAITDNDDIHAVQLMILATAEGAITIIAASVPILRPLFQSSTPSDAKFMYNDGQWEDTLPSEDKVETTLTSQPRISLNLDLKGLPRASSFMSWRSSGWGEREKRTLERSTGPSQPYIEPRQADEAETRSQLSRRTGGTIGQAF